MKQDDVLVKRSWLRIEKTKKTKMKNKIFTLVMEEFVVLVDQVASVGMAGPGLA